MYLNQITIIGNATRDAESKTTDNGKQRTRFAVAVSRGKDQPVDFFEVTCWDKAHVEEIVAKGSLVLVQGAMRSYKDANDNRHWGISADKVLLMNSKKKPKNSRQDDYEIYDPVG